MRDLQLDDSGTVVAVQERSAAMRNLKLDDDGEIVAVAGSKRSHA